MSTLQLAKYFCNRIFALFFLFVSSNVFAEIDTLALETIQVCNLELAYRDKGSGGDQDVAIYRPLAPSGYYIIGDYIQGNYNEPHTCTLAVKAVSKEADRLLISPGHWQIIWEDRGSGAHMDGSVWHAASPNRNYVCIGSVGQTGYNKPSIDNYRCVHQCLVENVSVTNHIWSDKGTGARQQVSMYRFGEGSMFYAKPDRAKPVSLLSLKSNPVCSGDIDTISVLPKGKKESTSDESQTVPKRKKSDWVNPDEVETAPVRKKSDWINPDTLP